MGVHDRRRHPASVNRDPPPRRRVSLGGHRLDIETRAAQIPRRPAQHSNGAPEPRAHV
jgi:hypothetical protein